jgi:hypothetical protein
MKYLIIQVAILWGKPGSKIFFRMIVFKNKISAAIWPVTQGMPLRCDRKRIMSTGSNLLGSFSNGKKTIFCVAYIVTKNCVRAGFMYI